MSGMQPAQEELRLSLIQHVWCRTREFLLDVPPADVRRMQLQLTGRPARSDFERLLAEAVTALGKERRARRGLVISWMNEAWFAHLYHPHYLLDDEWTWARFWVTRSEVQREMAAIEGDFFITVTAQE